MKIVVNDANILFDLLDIDLIGEFCMLPYEKMITEAVLNEFDDYALQAYQETFNSGRIGIYPLTAEQLEKVALLRKTYSAALSLPDCSCLFLAKELSAILLTGDKPLRKSARANKIRVHGSLWVMDQLVKEKIIDHKKAYKKLTLLMKVNNRLPLGECEKRLLIWKNRGDQ